MKNNYWIHALTPVHVGSGRGMGYIDLPIIREKITNWPIIPGSAVKGVMRDYHESNKSTQVTAAFGRSDTETSSGSVVFTDARLVCLPVRSFYGTFAWCASPMSLVRLQRDLKMTGAAGVPEVIPGLKDNSCVTATDSVLKNNGKVYLEDLDLVVTAGDAVAWAEYISSKVFSDKESQAEFRERFLILSDDVFNYLCETGTEVSAHIAIEKETKTVKKGQLWYEESLPVETILYGIAWCDKVFAKEVTPERLMEDICPKQPLRLQFGGKGTTGKGRVNMSFAAGGN